MGKLIYISDDEEQQVVVSITDDATATQFVEHGVACLMYGMGYFPTSVMRALSLEDSLDTLRRMYKEERV